MRPFFSFLRNFLLLFLVMCFLLSGCAQKGQPQADSSLLDEPSDSHSTPSETSIDPIVSDIPALAPSVSSSSENSRNSLSENPPSSGSFFDDAVFIGDSVSLKLKYYCMQQQKKGQTCLGQAQFLVSGNMGSGNALQPVSSDSIHPSYQGKKALLEDSIAQMGASKVFIMLGMNDIGLYGMETSLQNLDSLIGRILQKSPSASIFLQSVTPMLKGSERKSLNNTVIQEYNTRLQAYCQEKGYTYLDIASKVRDQDGFLIPEYCSDPEAMGIHFTDLACSVWVDCLNDIAA